MRSEMPRSSATCLSGRSSAVTARSTSSSRGVRPLRLMRSACTSSRVGAAAAGKARFDGLAFPDRRRQAEQPGAHERNADQHEQDQRCDHDGRYSRLRQHHGDSRRGERAQVVGGAAMPAHSCGVRMRGASCKNVVVKNVTKNPELR